MKRMLTAIGLSMVVAITAMAQAPASTPTVDQILERYVQAIGGKTAFEKLTTRVMTGTFDNFTTDLTIPIQIYAKAPDKRVEILANGEASRGFNGVVGWSLNVTENGLRELSGTSLASQKREAQFHGEVKLEELYSKLTLVGKGKVGDREAYVMEATPTEGNTQKLYFDLQTGLMVRRDAQVTVEIYFEDYRQVDGIKLPFTIRRKTPGGATSITFTEIKHNIPIEDSQFSVPSAR